MNMKKVTVWVMGVVAVLAIGSWVALKGKDTYAQSVASASLSDGVNVGSTITYTLFDQFGRPHTLEESTRTLILVFAKETGHIVKGYLGTQGVDYLQTHHAAFVADISPMPTVIRNTFALPDLKTQPYSVNLILDKTIATSFKQGADTEAITVLTLENRQVKKVDTIQTAQQLKALIER